MTQTMLRKLHKWVASIVGLQVVLWTVSGLVFTVMDHEAVSGEHLALMPSVPSLPAETVLTDPSTWIGSYADRVVHEVSLHPLERDWVYRIVHEGGIELR